MRYLKNRYLQSVVLLLALALVAAGCGNGGTGTTTATTGAGTTAAPGSTTAGGSSGTIRVAWETPPETFAPGTDQPDGFLRLPLETLVWRTVESGSDIVPLLAESWEETDQDLTLHLRQGVKFQDGTDFNAAAVVKNFQYVVDQAGPFSAPFAALTKIEAVDDFTVKLTKGEPNPALLIALTTRGGLIACPASLDDGSIAQVPCGTGAFKYNQQDSTAGTTWVFDRWDGYWDTSAQIEVKRLEMTFIAEASARVAALIAGEVDIEDQDMASITQTEAAGFPVYTWAALHYGLFMVDRGPGGVLEDVKVRQALCQGMDPAAIAASSPNFFTPMDQRYPQGVYGYNPNIVGYQFNQESADYLKTLNLKLDMGVFAANSVLGEALAGEFAAKDGVELSVQQVTPGEYFAGWYVNWKIGSGDNSEPDPYDWYKTWFAADAPNNTSGVESAELKAAADAAIAAGSSPEAEALWQEVMKIINDEALVCLHQAVNQGYGYNDKVVTNVVGYVGMPGHLEYRLLKLATG